MADPSNIERLREAHARWHEGRGEDVEFWFDICSPDMRLVSSAMGREGLAFTSPCCGHDELRGYFSKLSEDWTMDRYTVESFIGDGDEIVAQCSTKWTNKRTGKSFDILKADVWTFRDGKAVRFAEYYDSAPMLEAASA